LDRVSGPNGVAGPWSTIGKWKQDVVSARLQLPVPAMMAAALTDRVSEVAGPVTVTSGRMSVRRAALRSTSNCNRGWSNVPVPLAQVLGRASLSGKDIAMRDPRHVFGVVANYAATMTVILLGLWLYTRSNNFLSTEFNVKVTFHFAGGERIVSTSDLLVWLCAFYAIVLLPYYAMRPGFDCDARKVLAYAYEWAATRKQLDFGFDERRAALTLALKLFFVPLMLGFLLTNINEVMQHWHAVASEDPATSYAVRLNTSFFFLLLSVLFAIDVLIFTIGYMVEVPSLDNEIKSVDPTVLGWFSCLICYPPFNQIGFAFFSWQQIDSADFGTPLSQTVLAYLSVAAVAIFAWASVALGLRASNLTNRGIVNWGPYRWVRHPAYTTKNLAGWIAALPALADAFSKSLPDGLWILTCIVAWTLIYVVRALTEERHLLMIDNGYAEYRERVRFRFVPGLL
jgi:protein-S-isoprenylcysteine O-methyltransferase Ste14